MTFTIRPATPGDVGTLAHLMLAWDAELPSHARHLWGDAAHAERAARVIASSHTYITRIMEDNRRVIGGYTIAVITGLFCPIPYGILNVTVYPKCRGGKLYGLHLIRDAVKEAKKAKLAWLEANPWADAHGMQFVLERLGFDEMTRGYALRIELCQKVVGAASTPAR